MNIFVAKLSPNTTSEDIRVLFAEYGEVVSAKVIFDRETNSSKCYGFVVMKNDAEATKAIDELNECEYDHSVIVVKKAKPKKPGENTGRTAGNFRKF